MKKHRTPGMIPTRETFHREYAGEIRLSDFNTTYPSKRKKYPYTSLEAENRNLKAKELI